MLVNSTVPTIPNTATPLVNSPALPTGGIGAGGGSAIGTGPLGVAPIGAVLGAAVNVQKEARPLSPPVQLEVDPVLGLLATGADTSKAAEKKSTKDFFGDMGMAPVVQAAARKKVVVAATQPALASGINTATSNLSAAAIAASASTDAPTSVSASFNLDNILEKTGGVGWGGDQSLDFDLGLPDEDGSSKKGDARKSSRDKKGARTKDGKKKQRGLAVALADDQSTTTSTTADAGDG